MRKLIYLIVIALSILACTASEGIGQQMNDVESIIEDDPGKALEMLRAIAPEELGSGRNRARHALLHSMALDKNYIDLTTDSIIAPAVAYFRRHGSADERMKTQYYLGRIHINAGDHDAAMEAYVRAERHVPKCKDNLAIGRLYRAKMQVHKFLFDREGQLESAQQASHYYLESGDTSRYLLAVSDMASVHLELKDTASCLTCLDILKDNLHILSHSRKSSYYALRLHSGPADPKLLEEYLGCVNERYVYWLTVAEAYGRLSQYQNSLDALNKYEQFSSSLSSAYYWQLAEASRNLGRYEASSKAYLKYLSQTDSTDMLIFDSEARFIKERYDSQLASLRRRNTIVVLSLSLVIALLLGAQLAVFVRSLIRRHAEDREKFNKERISLHSQIDEYVRLYNLALSEKEKLSNIVSGSKVDKNLRRVIDERLAVLNGFIAANISANFSSEANAQLKHFMEDQNNFMESTSKSFTLTHPGFIKFLSKAGLNQWEIGCCCLYCIGLNGAEISSYLDKSLYYKSSGVIRKKLGLSRSINLDRFLKEKLAEFSC